ncbi:UPF0606 protein KIAA1549-like, partial [Carlito syrichta]|uniref:UPF0606 protein KIAA1549-like n=1 Tax=Carlito syrichta TaxID=1868482 RepID=A0A3Q0DW27_CARSF
MCGALIRRRLTPSFQELLGTDWKQRWDVLKVTDKLAPEQHNLSLDSMELLLTTSTGHSAAQVALTESASGPQQSSSLHVIASPSATAFDTAFFNQGKQIQSTADHNVYVANYVSVTSNEVAMDDDEMDNFLPDTHWTTAQMVSPIRCVTFSPPGIPREVLEPVLTPSLPVISLQDKEVPSAWQNTMQQPVTYAEFPSHFHAFLSAFPTSEGVIPPSSMNLVLYPSDIYNQLSSRTLPEIVASGTEDVETTLLFSSWSSVPRLLGSGITHQAFLSLGEVSQPPQEVLVTSTDRYTDMISALSQSLEETISTRAYPALTVSHAALGVSRTHSAFSSTPLVFVSSSAQLVSVSYNPFLPSDSSETSELLGNSVIPSHTDNTHILSPVSSFRPYLWCMSCAIMSPRQVLATSLMEKDMGSGDGAETLSVTMLEEGSISLLSSAIVDFSEFEEDSQEYNTLFPLRPIVPLSSRPVEISETSVGVSAEVAMSSFTATQGQPSLSGLSALSTLDPLTGLSHVAETQVMPSGLTATFLGITTVLLDSSFSLIASKNTPSLTIRDPGLFVSHSLVPSVESSLFSDQEPGSFFEHKSESVLNFASSFFSTPPLELSSSIPSPSEALASLLLSSDSSPFTSPSFSTLVETLRLSSSADLQSLRLSPPNFTDLEFSQLQPSSDLPLNPIPFLPSRSEASARSSFPSDSLKFAEASVVSLTDSEAHLTSAFTETTSGFEFSLIPHESVVTKLVPSSSEPVLDILTAGTHSTSPLTAFHTTPVVDESLLFLTPAPSDDQTSATHGYTPILTSFSEVIPTSTALNTNVHLSSASKFISEVIPSPLPTELTFMGPSFTPTDMSLNTSEPSIPDTSPVAGSPIATALNSSTVSWSPPEGDTAPPLPSFHLTTSFTLEAAVDTPVLATAKPPYVCDITIPDAYLITTVLARRAVQEYIITAIKEVLRIHFNRAVELKVYELFTDFTFLVTSGPFVYTAISVINVLINSKLVRDQTPLILSVKPSFLVPESRFQVQTVLQFVPPSVDTGFCNFTQRIEKGLMTALFEVRKHHQGTYNLTVQILNITVSSSRVAPRRGPVNIIFAVRSTQGFLNGSEVSELLRNLSMVEFSFYLGYPVLQIAEPFQYPQLNLSQLLKSSWVRTVLLGVMEKQLQNEVFQAEMERKLAQLLSEVSTRRRMWRRATVAAGNSVVQVVNVSRLEGDDDPVQLIYFVEDQDGERLSAVKSSDLINKIDLQRAAIILGYRIQGAVAQPVDRVKRPSPESQSNNLWVVVGVVIPVLVVTVIVIILYWKLCRTDKLDFQPDSVANIQQRQKLQIPSVKGFDFAKQHLGQHNKDDILIIHEPAPLPGPVKDHTTPSENGDVPSPKPKIPSKNIRHRGRVSPSDADSTVSEESSERDAGDKTPGAVTDGKSHRVPQSDLSSSRWFGVIRWFSMGVTCSFVGQ